MDKCAREQTETVRQRFVDNQALSEEIEEASHDENIRASACTAKPLIELTKDISPTTPCIVPFLFLHQMDKIW